MMSPPNKALPGEGGASPWSVKRVDKGSRANCVKCDIKFTSIIVKKHHCRSCGEVVCGNCSAKRTVLKSNEDTKKQVRLCDTCSEDTENCRFTVVSENTLADSSKLAQSFNTGKSNLAADFNSDNTSKKGSDCIGHSVSASAAAYELSSSPTRSPLKPSNINNINGNMGLSPNRSPRSPRRGSTAKKPLPSDLVLNENENENENEIEKDNTSQNQLTKTKTKNSGDAVKALIASTDGIPEATVSESLSEEVIKEEEKAVVVEDVQCASLNANELDLDAIPSPMQTLDQVIEENVSSGQGQGEEEDESPLRWTEVGSNKNKTPNSEGSGSWASSTSRQPTSLLKLYMKLNPDISPMMGGTNLSYDNTSNNSSNMNMSNSLSSFRIDENEDTEDNITSVWVGSPVNVSVSAINDGEAEKGQIEEMEQMGLSPGDDALLEAKRVNAVRRAEISLLKKNSIDSLLSMGEGDDLSLCEEGLIGEETTLDSTIQLQGQDEGKGKGKCSSESPGDEDLLQAKHRNALRRKEMMAKNNIQPPLFDVHDIYDIHEIVNEKESESESTEGESNFKGLDSSPGDVDLLAVKHRNAMRRAEMMAQNKLKQPGFEDEECLDELDELDELDVLEKILDNVEQKVSTETRVRNAMKKVITNRRGSQFLSGLNKLAVNAQEKSEKEYTEAEEEKERAPALLDGKVFGVAGCGGHWDTAQDAAKAIEATNPTNLALDLDQAELKAELDLQTAMDTITTTTTIVETEIKEEEAVVVVEKEETKPTPTATSYFFHYIVVLSLVILMGSTVGMTGQVSPLPPSRVTVKVSQAQVLSFDTSNKPSGSGSGSYKRFHEFHGPADVALYETAFDTPAPFEKIPSSGFVIALSKDVNAQLELDDGFSSFDIGSNSQHALELSSGNSYLGIDTLSSKRQAVVKVLKGVFGSVIQTIAEVREMQHEDFVHELI